MAEVLNGVEEQFVFAGFGGQGVLFAAKVVAYAGLLEDDEVSWLPSYGPEMRGGTANCSVVLSQRSIGFPIVSNPSMLVAMNQPSLDKFQAQVVDGGVIVADTSMIQDINTPDTATFVGIPATEIAEANELKGLANIVLLGRLWAERPFCARETLDAAIEKCVPPRKAALIDKNKQAIQIGIDLKE